MASIPNAPFVYSGETYGLSMGYPNIPFLNHVKRSKANELIDSWYNETQNPKCIVVYALLLQQMRLATEAKARHPDIKLCIIVPDLPRYMACNKYYKK